MERFSCDTRIIAGNGAVACLKELGSRRLLVVADPFFQNSGVAQRVAEAAGAEQTEFFCDITPDPTVALAAKGTAVAERFQPDTVVALGGGSVMDTAKAMVYFSGVQARLVAIPTTSGSGSEMTDFAVLTHSGIKHPLVDDRLRPDVAILDGALLESLPPSLVADGGFDALCHALEAYTAKNAGAFSRMAAKEAFCTVYALLPASFAGQKEVRLRIHCASAMAGLSFTHSGLGLCHAMAHSIGGIFHIPHGRLNAILLPHVVECNAICAGEAYARLAQAAGIGGSAQTLAVRHLKNALIRLRRQLCMPATLAEAGVRAAEVWSSSERIVKATLEDPCCATNPVPVEAFMVRRILEEVTGHG